MSDLTPIYERHLADLVVEITRLCDEHNIPFVAAFQVIEDGFRISSVLPDGSSQILMRVAQVFFPDNFYAMDEKKPDNN
jgi:hypothetical protein